MVGAARVAGMQTGRGGALYFRRRFQHALLFPGVGSLLQRQVHSFRPKLHFRGAFAVVV